MQVPSWYASDVSRETLEKLDAYAALIRKWTGKINLIARSTLNDLETRHIWDSAQVYSGESGEWCDLGSGAGLPGIVVAILAQGNNTPLNMTLVESDQRKGTFLRTCARELHLSITVCAERIENTEAKPHQIVSARALADLDKLLALAKPHLAPDGTCIFMKGARWQEEINAAMQNWRFSYEAQRSNTDTNAAILRIRGLERV